MGPRPDPGALEKRTAGEYHVCGCKLGPKKANKKTNKRKTKQTKTTKQVKKQNNKKKEVIQEKQCNNNKIKYETN